MTLDREMRRRGSVLMVFLLVLAALFLVATARASTRVVICHHPGPLEDPFAHRHTITVDDNAVPAHLRHGDTLGPCGSPVPTPMPTPTAVPTARPTPRATPRVTAQPTVQPTVQPTTRATLPPGPRVVIPTPDMTHTPMPTLPHTDTV